MGGSQANGEFLHGRLIFRVDISIDEVLKEEFRVLEVTGLVIIALAIDLAHGIGEVSFPPDKPLNIWRVEEILILLDEFLRTKVAVFVKEVDLEDLETVVIVAEAHQSGDHEGKEVAESSEANAGSDCIVVVAIEKLY